MADWSKFHCSCGLCSLHEPPPSLKALVLIIEQEHNREVIITSGHRCETCNARVGGSANSKHVDAIAIDFVVPGIPPHIVYTKFDNMFPNQFGLGLYNSHIHLDVRPVRARWDLTNA